MIKPLNNAACLVALLLVSATTSAATCTGATINKDMVIYVQRGMTVNDISGVLGCMPIEVPSGFVWETRDDSVRRQIAVDFASATAIRARYREIPLSPGVGVGGGNNNDTDTGAAAAVALIAFTASRGNVGSAASGCTPATINPSAIARIVPRTGIEAVIAILGCAPTEQVYAPLVNATVYTFKVPMLDVGVHVVVDGQGVSFAQYMDFSNPVVGSYNGAMRIELPPHWVPSAGTITPLR